MIARKKKEEGAQSSRTVQGGAGSDAGSDVGSDVGSDARLAALTSSSRPMMISVSNASTMVAPILVLPKIPAECPGWVGGWRTGGGGGGGGGGREVVVEGGGGSGTQHAQHADTISPKVHQPPKRDYEAAGGSPVRTGVRFRMTQIAQ